jgi:oligopeptidase A
MFKKFEVGDLESFPKRLKELLESHEKEISKIANSKEKDFTLAKRVDELEEERDLFFTPLSHLNSVLNSKKTQKAYEESIPIISKFYTKLGQNKKLYEKLKELKPKNSVQRKLLEDQIKDFELLGVNLSKEKKKRLQEIDEKLSELSNQFSQNLLDATNSWEMIIEEEKDIKGIPQSDLEVAKFEEDGKVKWRFTLQIPSYLAYITYGPNRSLREKIYKAYTTRAPQNSEIIDEILALRDEKAKILGFKNYASLALEKRDAKDEKRVLDFLWALVDESKKEAKKEFLELEEFAKRVDNIEKLEAYDVAYYQEKLKKEKFDFDENDTKPYFEQKRVVEGLFEILNELFEMEFKKVDIQTYLEEVEVWEIEKDGKKVARLYLDLEARKDKRGGAWMHNWESFFVDSKNNTHLPSAFVVCNFPKASKNYPSLLRHSDVVTLFHEIGHAIHHIFSKVPERSLSGVNGVAWDSVEFPSQFLENFAFEEAILERFAYHYKTKEKMPKELIKKIKQSKNFFWAMGMLRQLEFGLFDFILHQKLYQKEEVQELLDQIREKVSILKPPSYNKFQNGFSHIFAGGYAAGYYSYKWAEVFSADAFFECLGKNGEFKKEKALGYLEHILEKGATKQMSQLYKEWLGREPNVRSLIKLYTS